MSRSERWTSEEEIKRRFPETNTKGMGAGPVLHFINGKRHSDDGEAHIAVIGQTGKGKSQCSSLPFMREVLLKHESLVMIDPKGEGYRRNACYIPDDYQVFCIDFRSPRRSPTRWNPLSAPYRLFKSPNPDDVDIACSMVAELWSDVYPVSVHEDAFWPQSAANYAKGLTYGLFEAGMESDININTISAMMEQSDLTCSSGPATGFRRNTMINCFHASLPSDSLAKKCLASYVSGPDDTRNSIHSVAANGLEVFSRSKGLMYMLSEDTLNILDLDVDRPFVLIIITPDETNVYDSLSGFLISQVMQHLIRVAQNRGGKLPIRVNVILEELGSVGKSISTLANLCVASRSRGIRLMLILQSKDQLEDVYGKSKAETIYSSIGITIGFSTNSWDTLNEWAQRVGEKEVERNGQLVKEPLITPTQLAAMPTGTALVLADSKYKYIVHLPFYDEMYDNSDWKAPEYGDFEIIERYKPFNFSSLIDNLRRPKPQITFADLEAEALKSKKTSIPSMSEVFANGIPTENELDSIIRKIDMQIAELEAKEDGEKAYQIFIFGFTCNKTDVARVIAKHRNWGVRDTSKKLGHLPFIVGFDIRETALSLLRELKGMGCDVELKSKK